MPTLLGVMLDAGAVIWLANALNVLMGPAMYRGGYRRYAK
jgi:hypothetical protein